MKEPQEWNGQIDHDDQKMPAIPKRQKVDDDDNDSSWMLQDPDFVAKQRAIWEDLQQQNQRMPSQAERKKSPPLPPSASTTSSSRAPTWQQQGLNHQQAIWDTIQRRRESKPKEAPPILKKPPPPPPRRSLTASTRTTMSSRTSSTTSSHRPTTAVLQDSKIMPHPHDMDQSDSMMMMQSRTTTTILKKAVPPPPPRRSLTASTRTMSSSRGSSSTSSHRPTTTTTVLRDSKMPHAPQDVVDVDDRNMMQSSPTSPGDVVTETKQAMIKASTAAASMLPRVPGCFAVSDGSNHALHTDVQVLDKVKRMQAANNDPRRPFKNKQQHHQPMTMSIRGTHHVVQAIQQGTAQLVACSSCHALLQVPRTTKHLYCTLCGQVTPLMLDDHQKNTDDDTTTSTIVYDDEALARALQRQELASYHLG